MLRQVLPEHVGDPTLPFGALPPGAVRGLASRSEGKCGEWASWQRVGLLQAYRCCRWGCSPTRTWHALATAALIPLGVGAYLVALRLGVRELRSADPDNSDSEEEQ